VFVQKTFGASSELVQNMFVASSEQVQSFFRTGSELLQNMFREIISDLIIRSFVPVYATHDFFKLIE